MAAVEPLPQEIWWLVCQELTARRDFNSLFNFGLVNHSMAHIALPLLYSVHEQESASADDASAIGKAKLAALWRSIILSSIGKTFYPYCLWIKNLKLGSLRELLSDIAPYPHLRDAFFQKDMSLFNIFDGPTKAAMATRQTKSRLDLQAISNKVGDTITAFVKEAAERDNKIVALTRLEGQYIPMDILPVWTSRLSTLTSLTIQDGSVIGPQLAAAIRDNCPNFRELECFYCDGPTVDEDLAGFFDTLPQNSLQAFSVISMNRLGRQAVEALCHHASSLKKLGLSSLPDAALEHVGLLGPCTALETLTLEANSGTLVWQDKKDFSFLAAVSWLRGCSSLRRLQLFGVPGGAHLLGQVLKAPSVRLTELEVKLIDGDEKFYSSLACQTSLRSLSVRSDDEMLDLPTPQHAQFIHSVCRCHQLTELDLMQTQLSLSDVLDLSQSLKYLEEFSFDGDYIADDVFQPIIEMRHLKTLNIYALSAFTFDGILDFINQLGASAMPRHDFGLFIMNQAGHAKFSPDEEEILSQRMLSAIGGKLDIMYFGDPDEEHESDFSD